MRFPSVLLAGLVLALAPAAAAPASAAVSSSSVSSTSSASSSAPRLAASLTACETGVRESDRALAVRGSMPRRRGSDRLWMRFELQRRAAGSDRWSSVSLRTFGRWEKSRRGVAGFVYRKRVEDLTAPGTYRVVVRFRWKTASGRTLRSATRTSRVCRQPDPRPDLRVDRAALSLDGAHLDVTVMNAGRGRTAAPAAVVVRHGGVDVAMASVPVLERDETVDLRLPVPPCGAAGAFEVVLDPADGIDEADEDDNVHAVTCFR